MLLSYSSVVGIHQVNKMIWFCGLLFFQLGKWFLLYILWSGWSFRARQNIKKTCKCFWSMGSEYIEQKKWVYTDWIEEWANVSCLAIKKDSIVRISSFEKIPNSPNNFFVCRYFLPKSKLNRFGKMNFHEKLLRMGMKMRCLAPSLDNRNHIIASALYAVEKVRISLKLAHLKNMATDC